MFLLFPVSCAVSVLFPVIRYPFCAVMCYFFLRYSNAIFKIITVKKNFYGGVAPSVGRSSFPVMSSFLFLLSVSVPVIRIRSCYPYPFLCCPVAVLSLSCKNKTQEKHKKIETSSQKTKTKNLDGVLLK